MRRFFKRVRRPARWPEEIHMTIAGGITILLLFAAVVAFGKFGPHPAPSKSTTTEKAILK